MRPPSGLTQLYTGNGKGKTSAALGLALRAAGHGMRVRIVQFAKATDVASGEVVALRDIPEIELVRFGDSSVWGGLMPARDLPREAEVAAREAFTFAREAMMSGRFDVVVLDEICAVVALGLVEEDQVLELIATRPPRIELVLTGRGATAKLVAACDLVTEMADVRHPAERGAGMRKGIEY